MLALVGIPIRSEYLARLKKRFNWLASSLFTRKSLAAALRADSVALLRIFDACPGWNPDHDAKLQALYGLVTEIHPSEKVLVFTQFADTARYLAVELRKKDLSAVSGVTGDDDDPTALAWRFRSEE